MTRAWLGVLLAALCGCGHAKQVESPQKARAEQAKDEEHPRADGQRVRRDAGPRAPAKRAERADDNAERVPLATSPGGLMKPGAEARIQEKLVAKNLLASGHRNGKLDGRTRDALRKLQKQNDLPETGMPDHETVRKLGLDPEEIYLRKKDIPDDRE